MFWFSKVDDRRGGEQCPREMSSENRFFRSPTVVKICYGIEVMGDGVSWPRAAS